MEYYSAIKRNALESVLMRWMNLKPIKKEWSQKQKDISYANAPIWNLERRYRWTHLQGSNGDTDRENRLVDTVGEGEAETIWQCHGNIHITICTQRASSNLLPDTGISNQCSLTTSRAGMAQAGSRGRGHMCTYGCDSHWCMAESNTVL